MRIGIDISQLAYDNTGVANYLKNLVEHIAKQDTENTYILFYSSLRKPPPHLQFGPNFSVKRFTFPPLALDILWNRLHQLPIESFIGNVDVFISSDWTEPPARKAKKVTILYDLIVYRYPDEMSQKIVSTQKRKLQWVKKESDMIFCISEATKKDAAQILGIEEKRLAVLYPGV